MKRRIEQCRRLADFTTDQRVAEILLQMAEEAEADLSRMEAESVSAAQSITLQPDGG
jgi:hypothetical protein